MNPIVSLASVEIRFEPLVGSKLDKFSVGRNKHTSGQTPRCSPPSTQLCVLVSSRGYMWSCFKNEQFKVNIRFRQSRWMTCCSVIRKLSKTLVLRNHLFTFANSQKFWRFLSRRESRQRGLRGSFVLPSPRNGELPFYHTSKNGKQTNLFLALVHT